MYRNIKSRDFHIDKGDIKLAKKEKRMFNKKFLVLGVFAAFLIFPMASEAVQVLQDGTVVGDVHKFNFTNGPTVTESPGGTAVINMSTAGSRIEDADGDTFVDTENSTDEDYVRITAGSGSDDKLIVGNDDGSSYGTMEVTQSDSTATKPVISLNQYASDRAFINFIPTGGGNNVVTSSATDGTKTHAVKVLISIGNDIQYEGYIRVYNSGI